MTICLPAFGPDLPVHPFTGLTALGLRRNGAPIWPTLGGSDDAGGGDDADDDPGGDGGSDDDAPLGDAGKQAIARMKADRAAARKELRDAKAKLAEYEKAEQDKADADKSADERRAAAEKRAEEAELKALRLEVAHEKGLTPKLAKRLVGATREELEADADELLDDAPPARNEQEKPKPKPDKSQGTRGGAKLSSAERANARLVRMGLKQPAS